MTPKSESSLLAQQNSSDNIDTGKGLFNGQINKSLVLSQEIFSKPFWLFQKHFERLRRIWVTQKSENDEALTLDF